MACPWMGRVPFLIAQPLEFFPMEATIPRLDDHLPALLDFVRDLARQIEAGGLREGETLLRRFHDFYSVEKWVKRNEKCPNPA